MLHLRRLVWFIASRLILLCILCGMLVCGFYMCLNVADIYVILSDGLEKRVDVILTQEDAENLNFYFHADFLSTDPALEGAFDGSSVYDDYKISNFEYDLKVEKLWTWPWDNYATCTVVERVPSITGSVISSRKSEADAAVPSWQGGRYDITLVKTNGNWKIIGMQQTTILMEAVNSEGETTESEVKVS